MTSILYYHYIELTRHFESEGAEVVSELSDRASFQMKDWKRLDSEQLLQNVLTSSDFNNTISKTKDTFYISVLAGNGEHPPIAVISQQNETKEIRFIPTLADKVISTYNKARKLHEMQHSSIYKWKEVYYISTFTPINDENGKLIGIIGVDKNINDQFLFLKKFAVQTFALLIVSYLLVFLFVKKWLQKILQPINEMLVGLTELSIGNFDVKMEVNKNTELRGLKENFNEVVDNLTSLFFRLTKTAKEMGTISKEFQLKTIEDALLQMDNIVEVTKMNRELQEAEKMNAVGQLAASVAHEIRNPMTVVKGFLQIFHAKEHMSEEERTYIKLMIEEMNRAETIINDYLSLAKPDVSQSQKIDGEVLANKVIDLMRSYAMMGKGIHIEKDIQKVYIEANNNELKQVLINILKNAIEAMKNGGTVTIRLYKVKGYGVFEIEDTGIGMTIEEVNRLGTAFYSLKEKGTGMGLMVCYQMVEQMKGRIEVQSEKGRGTLFRIFIPLLVE